MCRRWSKGSSTSTSSERRLNPFWCSGADTDMETTTNEHGPRQTCTALTTDEAPVRGQVQDIQNWPQTLWVWPFTRRAWLLRAWARMRQRAQLDPAPPPQNPTRAFDFCAATGFAARRPAARGERSAFSPGVIGRPNEACRTARSQIARDAGQAGGTERRTRGTAQIESAASCKPKGGFCSGWAGARGNVLRSFPVDAHRGLDAISALKALQRIDRRLERRSAPKVVQAVAHCVVRRYRSRPTRPHDPRRCSFEGSFYEGSNRPPSGRHQR